MPNKTQQRAAAVRAAAVLLTIQASAVAQSGSTSASQTHPGSVLATPPATGGGGVSEDSQTEVHSIPVDMAPIIVLLRNHDKISFSVEPIPGGVRTIATSKDPAITKLLRLHAAEMRIRLQLGSNIRPTDPLFIELFRYHAAITATMRNVPGGVTEDETSKIPAVVLLIRAHAEVVGEFVRYGMPRAREPSPLPKGYQPAATAGN
jgi:hypothetical protein